MSIQEQPRKPWPRWAVHSTEGRRARFDCWGDVPKGWELEEALPGEKDVRRKPADEDISDLRSKYFEKFGKKPGPTWDADTLRDKLAE